jgi:hypothetical protein
MSSEFLTFLRIGVGHIADVRAYDHILFVAALTAAYRPSEWRRLLWLVTAFTIGHSVTLALATLDVVHVSSALVEVLIPVTIVITSGLTIAALRGGREAADAPGLGGQRGRYLIAGLFGLVHGLGFSTYLRSLLGGESSIVLPLFAFNLGLEGGQLMIVTSVLVLGVVAERVCGLARRDWVLVLSGGTAFVAATMIIDRLQAAS